MIFLFFLLYFCYLIDYYYICIVKNDINYEKTTIHYHFL